MLEECPKRGNETACLLPHSLDKHSMTCLSRQTAAINSTVLGALHLRSQVNHFSKATWKTAWKPFSFLTGALKFIIHNTIASVAKKKERKADNF